MNEIYHNMYKILNPIIMISKIFEYKTEDFGTILIQFIIIICK